MNGRLKGGSVEAGNLAIACIVCSKTIPADDVHLDTRLAKCRSCNAVFEFERQVRAHTPRPPVPLPRNMTLADGPSSLTIVRKWKFTSMTGFLLVFAGFWNVVVLIFVVALILVPGPKWEGTDKSVPLAFMWLFLTPFILVGFGSGYSALALLLNRTRIAIEGKRLEIIHQPIRWRGNHRLDTKQIAQLFCTEYAEHQSNGTPVYRMCVNALMTDGARIELVKGLEDAGQAFFLEQQIERHLGIENRPVDREYKGPAA